MKTNDDAFEVTDVTAPGTTIDGVPYEEWMAKALKPKISVIMQTRLADYPGSRKDPVMKFIRAVSLFQQQVYTNAELIIVADDCSITKNLYDTYYANYDNIKLVYVSRDSNEHSMYDTVNDLVYYRGVPRRMGVAAARGELITYVDSDDAFTKNHLLNIIGDYNRRPEKKFFIHRSFYEHVNILKVGHNKSDTHLPFNGTPKRINGLDGEWIETKLRKGKTMKTPWLLTHVSDITVKWRDCIDIPFNGEDADFYDQLMEVYDGHGTHINNTPTYIRCHLAGENGWDV